MYRPAATLPLFLLCLNCYAGCNVAIADGETISLVVGKSGCFRSVVQRQAFASDLKLAVQTMENTPVGEIHGKPSVDRPHGLGALQRVAAHPAPAPPVHYGQR